MNEAPLAQCDLLVVGGGINGAGIARDAAGRGLRVVLCEKDDLAQHTSSASTKLIHGGLRYLEHYDFALVRHALAEREVLLRSAPHIIWPLRFVLPHHAALRPRWLIRLGLFLYDHLGGRELLPASHGVDLRRHPAGAALKPQFTRAFEYSDCWVQDSRLVVLNAVDAMRLGAAVHTRTEVVAIARRGACWTATVEDHRDGARREISARAIANATGPWVGKTLDLDAGSDAKHAVRLVKGSHLVVRRLFDHPYPYIFQHADGRVLFAIPYEGEYTLLGTTDREIAGEPGEMRIDEDEVDYICAAVSEYFARPVNRDDIVWSYSGVRPLFDDQATNASEVTRDYVLHLDDEAAPLLSVYGGKITTYRRLAEQAVDLLGGALGVARRGWTKTSPLPGGDIPGADFEAFLARCAARYAWLPDDLLRDYARNYGTQIAALLDGRTRIEDLGEHFAGTLYAAEAEYLARHEWAQHADDVLWRRTRKGLALDAAATRRFGEWFAAHVKGAAGTAAARRGSALD